MLRIYLRRCLQVVIGGRDYTAFHVCPDLPAWGKGWRWEVRVKRLRVRVVVCCTLTHSLKLLDIELGRIDQTCTKGIFDDFVGCVDTKFPEDVLAVCGYGVYA